MPIICPSREEPEEPAPALGAPGPDYPGAHAVGFARRRGLWGALGVLVATLAVLIAAGLASSDPGPPPSGISLELDRAWVRAGGEVELRVLVPHRPGKELESIFGVESTLERKVGDRWVPTHHLAFGVLDSEPYFARHGAPNWAVPLVGFFGDDWRALRIPGDAEQGLHRIAKEVWVGDEGRRYSVPLYIS